METTIERKKKVHRDEDHDRTECTRSRPEMKRKESAPGVNLIKRSKIMLDGLPDHPSRLPFRRLHSPILHSIVSVWGLTPVGWECFGVWYLRRGSIAAVEGGDAILVSILVNHFGSFDLVHVDLVQSILVHSIRGSFDLIHVDLVQSILVQSIRGSTNLVHSIRGSFDSGHVDLIHVDLVHSIRGSWSRTSSRMAVAMCNGC